MASLGSFYSPIAVVEDVSVNSNIFGHQFLTSQEQKMMFANLGATLSPDMLNYNFKTVPAKTFHFSWGS